jgi:hypothetical protein
MGTRDFRVCAKLIHSNPISPIISSLICSNFATNSPVSLQTLKESVFDDKSSVMQFMLVVLNCQHMLK